MRLIFSFFLFLFTSFCFAQQSKNFFYTYAKGDKYVTVPQIVLQIAPSLGAAYGDTLSFGTPVNVLHTVPYSEVIDGYEIPWLKISYKKGEFTKVSFVLASKLSLASIKVENEVYFLGWEGRSFQKIDNLDSLITLYQNKFFFSSGNKSNFFEEIALEKNMNPDIVELYFNTKDLTGIKKTKGWFFFSISDKQMRLFINYNYLICNNSKLLSLPETSIKYLNDFTTQNQVLTLVPNRKYKSQFHITERTEVNKVLTNEKTTYYKFKDCSYSLIPPKK